jgi:HEAT repeat protein
MGGWLEWKEPPGVVSALVAALGDDDSDVRRAAAAALRWKGDGRQIAIRGLTDALARGTGNDRTAMLQALQSLGPAAGTACPTIVATLEQGNDLIREAPTEAPAVDVPTMEQINDLMRAVADAPDVGRRISKPTDATLEQGGPIMREAAANALGKICVSGGNAVPALTRALANDPSPDVREKAANALGYAGQNDAAAVGALSVALKDEALGVRIAAALARWRLTSEPTATLAVLQAALPDYRAMASLREMKAAASPAVPALCSRIRSGGDSDDPEHAILALAEIGPQPEAVEFLTSALTDRRADVRSLAAAALGRSGASARGAAAALTAALQDETVQVRAAASIALIQVGALDAAAVQHGLTQALRGDDEDLVEAALSAIETIGAASSDTLEAVSGLREDPSRTIAEKAGQALKGLQPD